MEKQKLIELLRKAYLSGIMENELAGRMVGVNHNLEDMATHYAEIEVNNGVLDDVIKCDKCGSTDLYQYSKTTDKCEECGNVQRFL